jgi:hypothetical protein
VTRPVIFIFYQCNAFSGKDDEFLHPQWPPGNTIDNYDAMMELFDRQKKLVQRTGPGHWNDSGMLDVGNGNKTTEEYVRTSHSGVCFLPR